MGRADEGSRISRRRPGRVRTRRRRNPRHRFRARDRSHFRRDGRSNRRHRRRTMSHRLKVDPGVLRRRRHLRSLRPVGRPVHGESRVGRRRLPELDHRDVRLGLRARDRGVPGVRRRPCRQSLRAPSPRRGRRPPRLQDGVLGRDDVQWGMGIGLMFFAVAEPISHLSAPPAGTASPNTEATAQQAMAISYFHWALHPWAIYAVVRLALAYFTFRRGMPNLISTAFHPLIGTASTGRSASR